MMGSFYLSKIKRKLLTILDRVEWHNLRYTTPVSNVFGLDRGKPIDRYYIEKFLAKNRSNIKGTVLEIADSYYSNMFGNENNNNQILHVTPDNPNATIIGDLSDLASLPENIIDCFI